MRTTKIIGLLLIFLISFVLNVKGDTIRIKLNQKTELWQSQPGKQIKFTGYQRVDFDFAKAPLKYVVKMVMFEDKIFILDNKRNELYVLDRTGKHLYTVGRPGQGPGDIEYGCDFKINNNKIYVLNMSKRISVFKIDGAPVGVIKLEDQGNMSLPTSIELDKNQDIILGSSYDPIISIFNSNGDLIKQPLRRAGMAAYKDISPRIGIPSSLILNGDVLYHLDKFIGVITSIDKSGNIIAVFNAYDDFRDRNIKETLEDSKANPGKSTFTCWANPCIDDSGNIYTLPRKAKEGGSQELLVFSKEGDFLYSKQLDFFRTMPIDQFSIYKNNFVFLTKDFDIFIVK